MRISIRNLVVHKDGRVLAEGPQPSVAPDWYEIDAQFQLILFGWRDEPPAPCGPEHCKDAVCDSKRAAAEMIGG